MKNLVNTLVTFTFTLCTVLSGLAQTGKITGTIMDGEFNEPMGVANVLIKNTSKGTRSDLDGKYAIEMETGSYTVIFS